jgi:hypothetical protein
LEIIRGFVVGNWLGNIGTVGFLVGKSVWGDKVGAFVGSPEGIIVGITVGTVDGMTVGTKVRVNIS